jgi:uncharacterized protein with von Willebrand factor type A (vWA) domain
VAVTLTDFAGHLRSIGVPVGLTEVVDAAAAVREIQAPSQAQLRSALAATLIKNHAHRPLFDLAFDDYLAELSGGRPAAPRPAPEPAGPDEDGRLGRLRELLTAALAQDDQAALRSLAELAVARYGGLEPGRVHGTGVYLRPRPRPAWPGRARPPSPAASWPARSAVGLISSGVTWRPRSAGT